MRVSVDHCELLLVVVSVCGVSGFIAILVMIGLVSFKMGRAIRRDSI
jgi:hypothetical protein